MAETELMPVEQTLPRNLFILPLVGNPIFPGLFTPLVVESKEDIEIVNQALNHGGNLGLLLVKDENKIDYEADNMYRVGTVAKIIKRIKLPDGGMNIFISTMKRFQVKDFHSGGKFIIADVEYLEDIEDNPTELKAWTRQLINETKKLSRGNPLFTEEMRLNMVNIDQS
ncbi:MAG: endopeptidase La, partial [Spirochaetia bacterium]|nr:endopeptidase La [Spirochaetia bacterium]